MSLQASPNSVHSQPHTYRGKIGVFLTGGTQSKHCSEGCGKHEVSRAHDAALGKMDGFKQSHQPGQGNIINQLNNDAIVVQLH